jgi:hypothetical protein
MKLVDEALAHAQKDERQKPFSGAQPLDDSPKL